MFSKIALLATVGVCMTGITYAQSPCSTDEHHHQLLLQHPQLAEFEKQFDDQLKAGLAKRTTATGPDTNTYDVPIVVHVVHDYGAENVSDDAVFNAASSWADTYMKRNADTAYVIAPFIPYIGNPKIRLHLATIDPNGNPTKGIVRQQSYLSNNADDQAKYTSWPNNKYINIWLIGTFGAGSTGAAAYAYYPSSGAYMPYYDGVISLYDYISVQKTIPHELGHVLNLSHTWGSTNSPGVACGDDNVDDTPPTKGHNPGCGAVSLYDVACASGYTHTYTSMSGLPDSLVDYPDTVNAQNIMDYTYCELMFSKGQVNRMRAALTAATAGRNNLITQANLVATGALQARPDLAPIPDFIMNKATDAGFITDSRTYFLTYNNLGNFSFRNTSWNDTVSGVSWTFSNGASVPTSTSMTTVTNRFSTPGWVTVTLDATSNAGTGTLVNTHAVYAADTIVAGGLGYSQLFGSAASVDNWPMFNYYNNQFRWEYYTGAGLTDNTCIRYRSFDTSARITGTATGDHDDVFTPAFDLAGIPDSLYLNFFTSCASTNSGISGWTDKVGDSMQVDVSTSGGARWTKLVGYNSAALVNAGTTNTDFVPTSFSQWKPRAVRIPATYRTGNVFFRFRYWPGNTGNNLYLDNFSINPAVSGVKDMVTTAGTLNIFPNPSTNGCSLVFKTGSDGQVVYTIKDLTGKTIYQDSKSLQPNTMQQEDVPRSATPAAGMYFVTVTVDGVSLTQKMVVY